MFPAVAIASAGLEHEGCYLRDNHDLQAEQPEDEGAPRRVLGQGEPDQRGQTHGGAVER